jgi:hypothetical protein
MKQIETHSDSTFFERKNALSDCLILNQEAKRRVHFSR